MAAVTILSDFGAQENKICPYFYFFLSICNEVMGPVTVSLVFLILSFKPAFSLSSFTAFFIKRLFSPSSLSTIRVLSSHRESAQLKQIYKVIPQVNMLRMMRAKFTTVKGKLRLKKNHEVMD